MNTIFSTILAESAAERPFFSLVVAATTSKLESAESSSPETGKISKSSGSAKVADFLSTGIQRASPRLPSYKIANLAASGCRVASSAASANADGTPLAWVLGDADANPAVNAATQRRAVKLPGPVPQVQAFTSPVETPFFVKHPTTHVASRDESRGGMISLNVVVSAFASCTANATTSVEKSIAADICFVFKSGKSPFDFFNKGNQCDHKSLSDRASGSPDQDC